MKGWIKLHRNIMNSETFSKLNAIQQLIAIYIILNANHEDGVWYDKYKNIEVPVKRGQLVTSRNKIANEWFKGDKEVTEQKVRTTLKKLERLGFLTITSTNNYTMLEVLNYNTYQKKEEETNQVPNQELTKKQPRDNQEITTNKNDKNDKNDKEIYIRDLYNHYLSKNIIQHKKLTEPMKRAINGRLKDYSFEELKKAIDNYAQVLKSDNHWFTHKYPLADLMRDKDIRKFLDEADPLNNFLIKGKSKSKKEIDWEAL